jgi:hypothetical protein
MCEEPECTNVSFAVCTICGRLCCKGHGSGPVDEFVCSACHEAGRDYVDDDS